MKDSELYGKLVDLYAGDELPSELRDELEAAAYGDPALSHEMATLRLTVQMVREIPAPEFTEESFHRILMRLYTRGVPARPSAPVPSHMQYRLPING